MHKLLEKLKKDHANLEKVLDLLSHQLDLFFKGKESNFDLIIELMEYMETYSDQGHHPLEDLIFQTVQGALDDDNSELIERLMTQHTQLIQLTRTFKHSLENVLQGGVMPRDELEVQGREYIALQRQHKDLEEQGLFDRIDQVMDKKDWQHVMDNLPQYDDPVFESPDKIRFYNLFEYLAKDQ